MNSNERLCIKCSVPIGKIYVPYKGLRLEARQCPTCKEKIFTEDLTMRAIQQLEAKQLKTEYAKHPIKIGHSWGITFPKEVAKIFDLTNPKQRVKIHPILTKKKIEILVG